VRYKPLRNFLPKWLKWTLISLCFFIVIVISYTVYIYIHIQNEQKDSFSQTKQRVLADTNIAYIEDVQQFQSEKAYHIVFGKTKNNDEKFLFVPLHDDEMVVINNEDIIAEEQIYEKWRARCQHCDLIQISPAMIDNEPLWEITYNDDDMYTFHYVSMIDGTMYERLQLTQMFK